MRQFAPGVGGLEDFVLQLASRQVEAGHDVRVVTLDRIFDGDANRLPATDRIGGIDVRRLPWFGSRRYPIAPRVLGAIRGADVVHVHALDFFFDFLALTRPLHRRKLVFSTHGLFFHTPFASRMKRLYFGTVTRLAASAYGAIFASSEQDAARFHTIRRRGVEAVENGVDIDKFAGAASPNARTIIYFGRLAPNKRVDLLLDWFAALHRIDPAWRLIVAGKPMGIAVGALEAQAADLGISDAVSIHDTPAQAELAALVGQASVYACASDYEGFGLAAIEGAAAGLFLALSPIPPFRRTVDTVGYGEIVDFTDPTSAGLFLAAWQARGERQPATRALLEHAYGWAGIADRFMAGYRRALGETARRIGPVSVAVLRMPEAFARIGVMIGHHRGTVAFANHHTVNMASRHPEVAELLDRSLVLCDGVAMDVASRMIYGARFPENLNGTDIIPRLLDHLPPTHIFLVGSKPGVAERAAAEMAATYPQHRFVGSHHGFPTEAESRALVETINAAEAELVFVGMGNPYQEQWIARHGDAIDAATICVGAYLDRVAGHVSRGPDWLVRWRLEWVGRIVQEPRRMIRRYGGGGIIFLGTLLRQKLSGYRI